MEPVASVVVPLSTDHAIPSPPPGSSSTMRPLMLIEPATGLRQPTIAIFELDGCTATAFAGKLIATHFGVISAPVLMPTNGSRKGSEPHKSETVPCHAFSWPPVSIRLGAKVGSRE